MAEELLTLLEDAENNLGTLLSEATSLLKTLITVDDKESFSDFLSEDGLRNLYIEKMDIDSVAKEFATISNMIKSMRSTYLPIDIIDKTAIGGVSKYSQYYSSSGVTSEVSQFESFENAFMRMLGMPGSDELANSGGIYCIDPMSNTQSGAPISLSYEEVMSLRLDERQQNPASRNIKIDNSILSLATYYNVVDETSVEQSAPRAETMNNDFFKCCYLLFPPVCDSRISKCINESQKVVAEPFSSIDSRKLSGKQLRPSMLESVIKMRLDKAGGNIANITSNDSFKDNFGIVESLMVLRLKTAIEAFASNYIDIIQALIKASEKTRKVAKPNTPPGGYTPSDSIDDKISKEQEDLEAQRLIEDSIFLLFGDANTIKTISSNKNLDSLNEGHLMSGILNIIEFPRREIQKRLSEIAKAHSKIAGPGAGESANNSTKQLVGANYGIGPIDVAAFALALFSIPEDALISLLSDKQFEMFKNGIYGYLLSDDILSKPLTTDAAINILSSYVHSSYRIFTSVFNISYFESKVLTSTDSLED